MQSRHEFASRDQKPDEDHMKFLDALERLRLQAYPTEDMTSRRYEILQRFIEGVRNPDLRRNLATMYAHERYLQEPPTVEELRFATQQYLRTRGPTRDFQPYNRPAYPARNQPPPDNVFPKVENNPPRQEIQSAPRQDQPNQPAEGQANQNAYARDLPRAQRPCFTCQSYGHFARDCPKRLQPRMEQPGNVPQQQVNQLVGGLPPRHSSSWKMPTNTQQDQHAFCDRCARTGHLSDVCDQFDPLPTSEVTDEMLMHEFGSTRSEDIETHTPRNNVNVIAVTAAQDGVPPDGVEGVEIRCEAEVVHLMA